MDRVTALVTPEAPPAEVSAPAASGAGTVALLILAALAAASIGHGGHYKRVAEICGALLAVAALLILTRIRSGASRPAKWALLGIGMMIVCTAATAFVDGHPSGALAPISLLTGLAVIVAGTALLAAPSRRQFADLVLGLGVFLAATAWVGVAFHLQPLGHPDGGLWRAATTISYANASAAVLGPLALWALARTTTFSTRLARLTVVFLVSGLLATLSRAGIASFAVGLVLLIVMLGFWPIWHRGGGPLLGGVIVTAGLVPGMAAGHAAKPWWAVLGLAIGVGVGVLPRYRDLGRRREMRWPQRRLLLATFVLLGVVGAAALIGLAGQNRLWSGRLGVSSPDRSSRDGRLAHVAQPPRYRSGPRAGLVLVDRRRPPAAGRPLRARRILAAGGRAGCRRFGRSRRARGRSRMDRDARSAWPWLPRLPSP